MNDLNANNNSSAEQVVYPLYRIDRAKSNTKRTSRLSLSKSKTIKAISKSECKTDIPESAIVISPFCLTNPIISHSPDTSSCSSAHSGTCTDEEILEESVSDLPDLKTVEFCDVSGRIEEKSTLPVDENDLPVQQMFEQIHSEDGRVYRVLEADILDLPLLDDPDFKFLDDYEPSAPVLPAAQQQTSSVPQQCPLDSHDKYCRKFAKHSKYNCWEARPWLLPLKLVQLRALDEYHSNFGRKDCDKTFRWQDIYLRKSEGAEIDSLEAKREEIAQYEEQVLQKAADVRDEKEKSKKWEEKVRAKFLPQHSRFPQVTRIRSDYKEVDVESMVDDYTEKVFEKYASTTDFKPNELPESVMQKDEDVVIFMCFNDNEEETQVIKKVGFSLGDTDECHHDMKVKFVPPFVPKREYY